MPKKLSYEELKERIRVLEKENVIQKMDMEVLRLEEERLRALTENTSDWLWEVDQDGKYIYTNFKVKELLGYDPHEIIGKTPFDFMPEDEAKRVSELFGEIITFLKPFTNLENVNVHKDGRQIVLETSGVPFFDLKGRFSGYRGIDRDLTERKRVEEALRESEEKYRLLIKNIPSVTWSSNEDGATNFISPNVKKIYGYSQDEIYKAGRTVWFDRIHPDDVDRVRRAFERLFSHNEEYDIEYRIQRKDGEWIWLHDQALSIIRKDNGHYAYGTFSDITQRKKAEIDLR